ncbi:MAG TPA: delta-60 repeat domain-containing protein [Solirubrobacterales bacterium]
MKGRLLAVAALAALLAAALAHAAMPGDFDRSFAGDGKARLSFCYHGAHFASVAIDSHNRIVTAGSGCLTRTLPSGRPDHRFNTAAKSRRALRSAPFPRGADAVTFDRGRIVVAGYYGSHEGFAVRRYKANGHADHSFGTGSIVGARAVGGPGAQRHKSTFTNFGDPEASALAVAIDSNRRPVVAGYTQGGGDADFALARLKWDGDLDPDFGSGGKVRTDFGTHRDYGAAVAIDSGGRIVVGGGGDRFELARYLPDGALDPSFGSGGKVVTGFGDRGRLNSIAIDSHNRIVAAGAAANGVFALARYKPNGRLDRSFSTNGKLLGPVRDESGVGSVGIDSRRRIVAVGRGRGSFKLARYKPSGRLDRSFGKDGKVIAAMGRPSVWSATIDSRDRIVVAASNSTLQLARFVGYGRH